MVAAEEVERSGQPGDSILKKRQMAFTNILEGRLRNPKGFGSSRWKGRVVFVDTRRG